ATPTASAVAPAGGRSPTKADFQIGSCGDIPKTPGGGNEAVARETQYRPAQGGAAPAEDPAFELIRKAEEALRRNDLAAAQTCAEQAQAMHPDPRWWEATWWVSSPQKIVAEIRRRAPAAGQASAPAGDDKQGDPRALVRQARTEFKKGS